jgi:uncharacterized RDD family membrane protein YckC
MNNPYSPPKAAVVDDSTKLPDPDDVEYAGFWIRVAAAIIDSLLIGFITAPILIWYYGFDSYLEPEAATTFIRGPFDFVVSYVLPAIAVVIFWIARSATPGKMLLSLKIVDAKTFGPITPGQAIGRYLGYYVSMFGLFLGIFWVGWDPRKQGWHDKLAGTVVTQGQK